MTQTRKDALQELLAKVEAGELTSIAKSYHLAMGGKTYDWEGRTKGALEADNAYRGSLDAAKALHNAVLPKWYVHDFGNNSKSMGWTMVIVSSNGEYISSHKGKSTRQENSARAWLIAILKALISETKQ